MNFALSPQTGNEFEQYLKTNLTGIAGEIKILEPLPEDEKNRANPAISLPTPHLLPFGSINTINSSYQFITALLSLLF